MPDLKVPILVILWLVSLVAAYGTGISRGRQIAAEEAALLGR